MAFMKTPTINTVNIVLIIMSCVAAHYFPYHLLILSYAILGPAHYLTQISWLHDRQYFVNSNLIMPLFVFLTVLLCVVINIEVSGVLLNLALLVALILVLPTDIRWHSIALVLGVAYIYDASITPSMTLFIALLLPTVLHVFVFTACFMWVGAIKSRQTSAYVALFALLICAATFLIPMTSVTQANLLGLAYFQPVVIYMQSLLPVSINETNLFGFLGFAYTYHYLNWFSKAEIIHWNKIPRRRFVAIIAVYTIAMGAYLYDYILGFQLLLSLSLLHVLLEFPLNMRTFATIASSLRLQSKA
jgi:hypothetical protein